MLWRKLAGEKAVQPGDASSRPWSRLLANMLPPEGIRSPGGSVGVVNDRPRRPSVGGQVPAVTTVVASLALLKVLWDRHRRDYLGTFAPIVAESIRRSGQQVIALGDLQHAVESDFGLRIPQHSLNAVLNVLRRQGFVRLEDHAYIPNEGRLSDLGFDRAQREVTRLYDDLVRDIVTYVKEHHELEWTTDKAEAALLDQLRQRRMQLGAASDEQLLSDRGSSDADRFFVAEYITTLREVKSPRLADVEAVAMGYMLANILYLADAGQISRKFRNTEVFFDTPFIINALGYNGPARAAPATELLALLYETGAQLRCFEHTRDEARAALEACASHVRRGPDANLRGPALESVQYFLAQGLTASDVEFFASQLGRSLESLRIKVVSTPSYVDHRFVIDEKALAKAIKEEMVHYREGALDKDVTSIAAIVRTRAGLISQAIEASRAVLVTTNGTLVRVVPEVLRDRWIEVFGSTLGYRFRNDESALVKATHGSPRLAIEEIAR